MNGSDARLLRFSLVAVWWITAWVSLWELHGQSQQVLSAAGIAPGATAHALIVSAAGVDLLIGSALAFWPTRRVYQAALVMMTVMTLVATVLSPALWLHPLGPLTKNLPIAAILWTLIRATK